MENHELTKMNDALARLSLSAGFNAVEKVKEMRDRHAVIYRLDSDTFDNVVRKSLFLNVIEGSCRMIDRSRIPE